VRRVLEHIELLGGNPYLTSLVDRLKTIYRLPAADAAKEPKNNVANSVNWILGETRTITCGGRGSGVVGWIQKFMGLRS